MYLNSNAFYYQMFSLWILSLYILYVSAVHSPLVVVVLNGYRGAIITVIITLTCNAHGITQCSKVGYCKSHVNNELHNHNFESNMISLLGYLVIITSLDKYVDICSTSHDLIQLE